MDRVVPIVVTLGCLLLQSGKVDGLHLQQRLHLMPHDKGSRHNGSDSQGCNGDTPSPALLPTQEGIVGRDDGDSGQNHIAGEGFEDVDLIGKPEQQKPH